MKSWIKFLVIALLIAKNIWAISNESEVFIIGIAGGSGSGKTYVADKLKHIFGEEVTLLSMDSYYYDFNEKGVPPEKRNFDHPDAFDIELFKEHLNFLKEGKDITVPHYDFVTSSRPGTFFTVTPSKFVIIEGILLLHDEHVRDYLDYKVFIDTEDELRFTRRLARDMKERGRSEASVYKQYYTTVFPMYQQFVKATANFADLVIPSSDLHREVYEEIMNFYELRSKQAAATRKCSH